MAAQGAQGVQQMEQQAQQQVAYGGYLREQGENERQMNLLQLKAGRQQTQRDFRGQMQAQKGAIMGGVGDILGAGLQGFASGGGFTKDGFSMDTFLGRESGNQSVIDMAKKTLGPKNQLDALLKKNAFIDADGDGIPDLIQAPDTIEKIATQ